MTVTPLPFELHPDFPVEGIDVRARWGDRWTRARAMYERVGEECEAAGLPFRIPERIPNSRRALLTAEYVRQHDAAAFERLDAALFRAHFADGLFLGDQSVLDDLVTAAGGDAREVRDAVDAGAVDESLRSSMEAAYELGISATPTWVVAGMLVPGLQARETYERVVARARERA